MTAPAINHSDYRVKSSKCLPPNAAAPENHIISDNFGIPRITYQQPNKRQAQSDEENRQMEYRREITLPLAHLNEKLIAVKHHFEIYQLNDRNWRQS